MIGLLTWPARAAFNLALDVVFGKEEPFDYVSTTAPPCPPPYVVEGGVDELGYRRAA